MDYISYDAIVIGTGAAGYSAAIRIARMGKKKVAVVTEGVNAGTSRNTGSDKQTYYKLGLGGEATDSVRKMAADLFAGGCVDGDNALCEAALSARCFMDLSESGVPFPTNRYGEYIGYKTDHDPYARATSAGPLTSRYMTEALEANAKALHIPVYDGYMAVEILHNAEGVCGVLCLDQKSGEYAAFRAPHVVMATGGPAGVYADIVYPKGHTGASSLAIRAGAEFQNMAFWQYGLASTAPRWNVSGTYMQVLPRFVSVGEDGVEHEFLLEHYAEVYSALSMVFLKGYQWPFDPKKVPNGSSVIDLLVYEEQTVHGRQVYLDYRRNPFDLEEIEINKLSAEATNYLTAAGALQPTPIERLIHMNRPAYELYLSKGVDLQKEMLPISLCAQHHNGGISVDLWWQTTVPGLFAVGECAGTHGIARPGGSALNAGQVGALRAAQYISQSQRISDDTAFRDVLYIGLENHRKLVSSMLNNADNVEEALCNARRRMSAVGGAVRELSSIEKALQEVDAELSHFDRKTGIASLSQLPQAYRYRDALICQQAILSAMADQLRHEISADTVQQGCTECGQVRLYRRPVRPLPDGQDVFETVWRGYRENQNIY